MKSIPLILDFDGGKFMARYAVSKGEFFAAEVSPQRIPTLFYPDRIGDSPILEACDPPPSLPRPAAEIERLKSGTGTAGDMMVAFAYMLKKTGL